MDEKTRESNRLRQRKFLELHKDEVNEKRRDKYHERISHGKCPRCGSKTKKGRTLCADCCDYMLNLNRKYAKRNKTTVKAKTPVKKTKKAAPKAKAKIKRTTTVKTRKAPKKKTR
jgi:predicted nucleic acid-binding Zn ribbon protein